MIAAVLWLLASYLLGSIPTSYLVARIFKGVDLRTQGSQNLGATNLYRFLGWKYAIPAGLFDAAKGAIPVWVFGPQVPELPLLPLFCGMAAVVGHVFSVFVGFKGGKGVATASGVVLALAPWALLVVLVVWVATVRLTGYVSLGSVVSAALFPFAAYLLERSRGPVLAVEIALAVFIVWKHRANLRRLAAGTENRFGRRAGQGPSPSERGEPAGRTP